jgi:hypothetical protein
MYHIYLIYFFGEREGIRQKNIVSYSSRRNLHVNFEYMLFKERTRKKNELP